MGGVGVGVTEEVGEGDGGEGVVVGEGALEELDHDDGEMQVVIVLWNSTAML